jgi:hypothetical protein
MSDMQVVRSEGFTKFLVFGFNFRQIRVKIVISCTDGTSDLQLYELIGVKIRFVFLHLHFFCVTESQFQVLMYT